MHPYVHSSTSHSSRYMKQPKCPPRDDWIKKMWYMYITAYYSAMKKNKIMSFAADGCN